jgi:hypothetical protein
MTGRENGEVPDDDDGGGLSMEGVTFEDEVIEEAIVIEDDEDEDDAEPDVTMRVDAAAPIESEETSAGAVVLFPVPRGASDTQDDASAEDASAEDGSVIFGDLLAGIRKLSETDISKAYAIMKQAIRARLAGAAKDKILSAVGKALKITAPKKLEGYWAQCAAQVAAEDFVPPSEEELAAQAEAEAEAQAEAEAKAQAEADALYEKCKLLAEDPDLMLRIGEIAAKLGVVEEKQAVHAVYLTGSSRLNRRKAMSLLRSGSAAGGKSHVPEKVAKLFPPGSVIRSSGSSPKILPYYGGADDENSLAHRIVYIIEAASIAHMPGVENPAATMWRTLISENRLDYQTVMLVEGGTPITISILKNGPIAVWMSSATPVEDQTNTRLIENAADESDAQTNRIIDSILNDEDSEAEDPVDVETWQAFQEWLAHGGPYLVRIPYLGAVRKAYHEHKRSVPLRFRRDLGSFVTAIRTSAIIHRAQRQADSKGRIIAELRDYEVAYDALNSSISELYGAKPARHTKALVTAVETFIAGEKAARLREEAGPNYALGAGVNEPSRNAAKVTIRALAKELGLSSRKLASERLGEALTLELIEIVDIGRAYGRTETKWYRVLVPSKDLDDEGVAISTLPKTADVDRQIKAAEDRRKGATP